MCRTKVDLSPDATSPQNNHGHDVAPLEKVILFLGRLHGLQSVPLNKLWCVTPLTHQKKHFSFGLDIPLRTIYIKIYSLNK